MILKTSSFPMGPAKHLGPDYMVQRMNGRKRLVDCYVHDLTAGDEYYVPDEEGRQLSDFIDYIEEHNVSFYYDYDVDGNPESVTALSFGEVELAKMNIGSEPWFCDFMNYVLDLHEGICFG